MKFIGTFVPLSALTSNTVASGTFSAALVFLDWLHQTGQNAWQLLPLHQTQFETGSRTTRVPSPYKGYGIGLNPVYLTVSQKKLQPTLQELRDFSTNQAYWLPDYCLYCALAEYFKTDDWSLWPDDIRNAGSRARLTWTKKLSASIKKFQIEQWQLFMGLTPIRVKAKRLQIRLIGDFPFYLSIKSPLVWRYQSLFCINHQGRMTRVTGAPSGPYAQFGRQLWGHPLYNWQDKKNHASLIRIFEKRLKFMSELFDMFRLDHAKGFYQYGYMDPTDPKKDVYLPGPGYSVLKSLVDYSRSLHLTIFAEDSGDMVEALIKDLDKLNVAGIRILSFGLTTKITETFFPRYAEVAKYPEKVVAYTTTHDTKPLLPHLKEDLNPAQRQKLANAAGVASYMSVTDLAVKLRQALIHSAAELCLVPIQDWLLTSDRINIPGTEMEVGDKNWQYKLAIPVEKLPLISW